MEMLIQGDTWEFEYKLADQLGNDIDLSNWEVRVGVKDSNDTVKIMKNFNAGGNDTQVKVMDLIGTISIVFQKEDTSNLKSGILLFEIEITSTAGRRYTVVRENYEVAEGII